jgi:hypothetical protein
VNDDDRDPMSPADVLWLLGLFALSSAIIVFTAFLIFW